MLEGTAELKPASTPGLHYRAWRIIQLHYRPGSTAGLRLAHVTGLRTGTA